ncbi:MAG TPA: fumarylacetoacetate hydrolase family protein [Opitutaceae bacterium]
MKLIRFGNRKQEKPGVLDASGVRRDCSKYFFDYDATFFAGGGLEKLAGLDISTLPIVPKAERWGAPVARPGKTICVGLNYRDHAEESNMPVPGEPVLFFKAPNSVVGPNDALLIPRGSTKTDWEVELGLIIGREARYLTSREAAWECIAGYCISHDVSERHFQLERGGQWMKGKSCDTFNPLGPWLATRDEIGNVNDLDMTLRVNGQLRQNGNTRTMIFPVDEIVRYTSQFMTLEPGDLITTGTPPGVGLGMKPPMFLKAGDTVDLSIAGLGTQCQVCADA